jgi:hypothetical protein
MLDDHTSLNRSRLGFGPNRESYNLELSWLKPLYTLVLTAKGESPGKAHFDQDLGGALALRWHLWSGRELGISVISTRSQLNSLTAMGLHNFWTFSPKWHGLLQWDLIQEDQKTLFITRNGHTFIGRVEYEIFQGLSLSMGYEMSYTDVFSPASLEEYYRTSIRWFPRSHWEILTIYKWKRNPGVNSNFSEIGSWMVHFYL